MRRRTPIRIVNGKVYAWVRDGKQHDLPFFILAHISPLIAAGKKVQVLSYPRNTGFVQKLETPE